MNKNSITELYKGLTDEQIKEKKEQQIRKN